MSEAIAQFEDPKPIERTSAAAMHCLSIFTPFIGPAVFYLVHKQRSPFVASHALQALWEALVLKATLAVAMVASISYTVYKLVVLYQNDWQGFSWEEFLIRFAAGWLALMLLGVITTAVSVKQALNAYHGRWPKQARVVARLSGVPRQAGSTGTSLPQ